MFDDCTALVSRAVSSSAGSDTRRAGMGAGATSGGSEEVSPAALPAVAGQSTSSGAPPSVPQEPCRKSSASRSPARHKDREYCFEQFSPSFQVRDLPVVVFSDDVEKQIIWQDGEVRNGTVHVEGRPLCISDPVVMSNASKGFVVEPYEERYLHFRDVGIVFARPTGGRFMQPSIDTMLVCRALVDAMQDATDVRRVIDVGSGSGLIGKFAAACAPGTGELEATLVDIDPKAMSYCNSAGFNAKGMSGKGDRPISWKFLAKDAVQLLEGDAAYDVIVSNPPYIPTKSETMTDTLAPASGGFWEGISLVVFLLALVIERRLAPGGRLVMMVTSLTLKSPAVVRALEEAVESGCRLRILLEREIAWKAWYAGPSALSHLLASSAEQHRKRRIAGCDFFVGATESGESRVGGDRDRYWGYHWHYAYVIEVRALD
eukprot:TRINITY_DN51940_c0_g1_i1.p1 TRINITY_DN51940_c0_g1~~TRINITY_DN51940_c0_g1_i1.p1  ORF type:complete len:431 (-),score=83.79 TRINITY_DN51940_c0_g1_i1:40-1332(-)